MLTPNKLSATRKSELKSMMGKIGKANDPYWALAALQLKSQDAWEQWGFGLFKTPDFQKDVDQYLKDNYDDIHDFIDNPKEEGYEERQKALYHIDGWSKEFYQKVLQSYKKGKLTIGHLRAIREEDFALQKGETVQDRWNWIKNNPRNPQFYTRVCLLLAENKPEEKLTDVERILILAYCHPQVKVVIPPPKRPVELTSALRKKSKSIFDD